MRGRASACLVSAALLSGCAAELSPELRAQGARNRAANAEIWAGRQRVAVAGAPYEVGVAPDRSFALAAPEGPRFTVAALEAAVRTVTGCVARADVFVAMLAPSPDTPLDVSTLADGDGRARVDVDC